MNPRVIAIALLATGVVQAQQFDVTSVKLNNSDGVSTANFPLGPGDVYIPNGGLFSATRYPLATYVSFAYKMMANDAQALTAQLPGWAASDRYDVQARAEGNPTKDQMRLMMRSLLADRFKLTVHKETKEVPAYALVVANPGKLGPQLRAHVNDAPCPTEVAPPSGGARAVFPNLPDGLPALCGGIFGVPASVEGRQKGAARNVPMSLIANSLTAVANLGRPVVDHTGLAGTFDFSLEWAPDPANGPGDANALSDSNGPTFAQALKEQLGLKLESTKAPVEVFVIDHVERPSDN